MRETEFPSYRTRSLLLTKSFVDGLCCSRSVVLHTIEVREQNAELLFLILVHVEDGAVYTSIWSTQCVCSFSASKQGISFNRTYQLFFELARQYVCCAAGTGVLYITEMNGSQSFLCRNQSRKSD